VLQLFRDKRNHSVLKRRSSPVRNEITEAIHKFERGEVTRDDLPRMVVQIADVLADLIRLSGSVLAGLLSRRCISGANGELKGGANDAGSNAHIERVALKVTEAASMLGVSRSALYEMIYKREIGVVRFGNRSIRVPRNEIERLLIESLIPRLVR
jgi:excisionase family DNA binding protein